MILNWELHPLHGWGPLRFGMTADAVLAAAPTLGPPLTVCAVDDRTAAEHRAITVPILHYRDHRLAEIDTSPRCAGLRAYGVPIYQVEPSVVLTSLLQADPAPLELLGGLFFPALHVSADGYWNFAERRPMTLAELADDDIRGMAVALPGSFDSLRDEMTDPGLIRIL